MGLEQAEMDIYWAVSKISKFGIISKPHKKVASFFEWIWLEKMPNTSGLRFILSYYSPDLIDRKDLSYITLAYGVEDSRIRLESVKKLNKDSELRAIANYIESKMYIAKKSIDLHNLKLQIGMFWKENQLENKSINYFYTGISRYKNN